MPSWSDILQEITQSAAANQGRPDLDGIRDGYLRRLHDLTGRSAVVYATNWLPPAPGGPATSIVLGDMQGLMEVFHQLPGPGLDLILHSPGGQAEATDRLVRYMRSKFSHVRVFVPLAAMSAATMWAMAADEIVMGKHSQVGPIDPQITLPGTGVPVPAGALLDQFQRASDELAADPSRIPVWLPILQQYPPGILNVCESAAALSVQLVAEWLTAYMLKRQRERKPTAEAIAKWLGDDKAHLSHSRAITRDQLRRMKIKVRALESDAALQDAILSVHHATMHTLTMSGALKIIENNLGRRYVQQGSSQVFVPMQVPPQFPPGPPVMPPVMPPSGL